MLSEWCWKALVWAFGQPRAHHGLTARLGGNGQDVGRYSWHWTTGRPAPAEECSICMLLGARTQDILLYTQAGSLDTPQREIYLELSCFSTARCLFLRRRPGKIQSASTRSRNTPDLSAMNREVHAVRPISQFLFLCPSHFSKVVVLLPFSLYTEPERVHDKRVGRML